MNRKTSEGLKHFELCQANLCAEEDAHTDNPNWRDDLPWYSGEAVCGKKPSTKWQKRQAKINRFLEKGLFKYPDFFFTVETLSKIKHLSKSIKGKNPDMEVM